MKRIGLIHVLILVLGSALCFAGSFYFALQKTIAVAKATLPPPAPPKPVVHESPKPTDETMEQRWVVPQKVAEELDGWRKELNERERKILAMDAELLKRDNLLKAEREALNKEREKLTGLQREIESRLLHVSQTEVTNLEQIAQLYSTMKPADAAGIMRQLADEQTARMLGIMKPTKSAKILEIWSRTYPDDRERLARISDQMRVVVKEDDQPKVTINSQP